MYTAYHYIIQMDVTKKKCFKSFTPTDPLSTYTEKNDSLNLLNFFKVSGRNQFILATFK